MEIFFKVRWSGPKFNALWKNFSKCVIFSKCVATMHRKPGGKVKTNETCNIPSDLGGPHYVGGWPSITDGKHS